MAPTLYLTRNQDSASGTVAYFELRAAGGEPGALTGSVKSAIGDIDRSASLEFNTLATKIDASLSRERLLAALSALFGTLAVVLAMIGLYGVISYLTISLGDGMRLGSVWPLGQSRDVYSEW
jgi:hypothetical protein